MELITDPKLSARDKIIANLLNLFGWVIVLISLGEVAIHYAIFPAPLSTYSLAACIGFTVLGSVLVALSAIWPVGKPQWQSTIRRLLWPLVVRRRRLAALSIVALWAILEFQVTSIRNDFAVYVTPRTISAAQFDKLRDAATEPLKQPLIIRVNARDEEAREFSAQMFNALRQSKWDVKWDAIDADSETIRKTVSPLPLNSGLCLNTSVAQDQKHDAIAALRHVLSEAGIQDNCGGGAPEGDQNVYILVGPRPRAMGQSPSLLFQFGDWLRRIGG